MDNTQKRHSLFASHTDAPDTYTIDLRDVYYFEKAQIQKNSTYDETLANELFDRLEDAVFRKAKSIFTPIDGGFVSDKHRLMDERYGKAYLKLRERVALDYFCRVNNCYSFDNQVTIDKSHEEYTYWFSFKLRQYDLYLEKTASFLSFQLKKNFNKKLEKFLEILDLSLDQYPELFSNRLRKRVQRWMAEKRKPKEQTQESSNLAQTSNKSKTAKEDQFVIDVQTYIELENATEDKDLKEEFTATAKDDKPKRKKRAHPAFTWMDSKNKEKQLTILYDNLIYKKFISKISFWDFKKHFDNISEGIPPINWITVQYGLIYLIDNLKPYLNPELYKGKDESIAIAYFEKHFLYNEKKLIMSVWRKTKSENEGIKNELTDSIDLIISHLKNTK